MHPKPYTQNRMRAGCAGFGAVSAGLGLRSFRIQGGSGFRVYSLALRPLFRFCDVVHRI